MGTSERWCRFRCRSCDQPLSYTGPEHLAAELRTDFFGTAGKAGGSIEPGMLSNRLSLISLLLLKAVDYCAGKGGRK